MLRSCRLSRGVSLWELLVSMAIAGTLAAAALPSFSLTGARARLVASHNLLIGSLHYARSTAILRNVPTAVCLSADGERCMLQAGAAARGWLVFHDVARHGAVQLETGDTLLRHVEVPAPVTVRGSRAAVTYWPVSLAGTTSTFLFCHPGRAADGRAIIVSQSGRPRTAVDGAWTARLECPA